MLRSSSRLDEHVCKLEDMYMYMTQPSVRSQLATAMKHFQRFESFFIRLQINELLKHSARFILEKIMDKYHITFKQSE